MSREEADEIQHSKGVSVSPLVLAVERVLADEERDGGHTARSLASLIVRMMLSDLIGQGAPDAAQAAQGRTEEAEEMNETDALITRRLIAFYEGMIRRGEIVPAPELLPIVRSTES